MQARHKGKRLVALFVLATTVLLSGIPAFAAYPDRVIKIIVPFAPGGGTDAIARVLAQEMAKDLGASIIIENKPGAGTIIGAQAVASAEADGYTLLMGSFAHAVNPSLNAKLPFDPNKDFAPVALVARSPNIVVVNPKSSFRSIADLIAAAKAEPEKISYGTFGAGTSAHLAGEMFKHMAKVNMTMVPYKGSAPAITDLIGGQIQVMFTTVASAAVPDRGRSAACAGGDHGGTLARLSAFADGRRNRPSRASRRKPGMACLRRRKRRLTSSTASTSRRPRRCRPTPSKSLASMRASC